MLDEVGFDTIEDTVVMDTVGLEMTGHTQVLEIIGFETIEDKVAMGVLKVTDEDKDLQVFGVTSDAELEEKLEKLETSANISLTLLLLVSINKP